MRRVVITGIGLVGAHGIDKEKFWNSLLEKQTIICPVPTEFEKTYRFKSRFFVSAPQLPMDGLNNMMEDIAKIAVVAAKLAVEDTNLSACTDTGVILGVGMSSLKTGLQSYTAHISGNGRYHRMGIPMLMPNSAAAWVSISLGAQEMCYTLNAACASGTIAIGEAFLHIKNGRLDTALTGGVDCFDDGCGAIMRGFDMLTTLTTAKDGNPMPFSKQRSGFLLNMGAGCILVLEELEHARRRGADIYAEILDYKSNNDANSIVQMLPSGAKILDLFNNSRGVKIDYLNSHGTATIQNDAIEAEVIGKVFGDSQPFINSTKGIIGHSIGASGAIEAAVTALSIKHKLIHGNITKDIIDGLNLPLDTMKVDIQKAISVSYGFGGHNALLMLGRCENE